MELGGRSEKNTLRTFGPKAKEEAVGLKKYVVRSFINVAVPRRVLLGDNFFLLNTSKHNTNEICIIIFSGVLLHVSAPGSHHQAKYNKRIPNY
jgi:hypothetical protein